MSEQATPNPSVWKSNPKVALVNLADSECAILRTSLREFSLQAIMLAGIGVERLKNEKFSAGVLHLQDENEPLLERLRASPLNKRIVLYGICCSSEEVGHYSKYGINVLLMAPLASEAVAKVIRDTHLLVRGELRCFVRVPLVTEVSITVGDKTFTTASQEISIGGMSLMLVEDLPENQRIQISFSLPDSPKLALTAAVCWKKTGSVGVRFDRSPQRENVRKWVESYLEIA